MLLRINNLHKNVRDNCSFNLRVYSEHSTGKVFLALLYHISGLKQATFLTTRTLTGSKFDVINQSTFLTQSFDVTHAVRVVKKRSLQLENSTQLCNFC